MFVSIFSLSLTGGKEFSRKCEGLGFGFFFFFGFFWLRNGGEDCVDFSLVGLKFGKVGFEF